MLRTPPPGPPIHRQPSHPSNMSHQEHGGGSLYPPADDDELDSPSRHENVTPLAPSELGPSLRDIIAAINAQGAEASENRRDSQELQRQVQDLNALFVRPNSPPNSENRSQFT